MIAKLSNLATNLLMEDWFLQQDSSPEEASTEAATCISRARDEDIFRLEGGLEIVKKPDGFYMRKHVETERETWLRQVAAEAAERLFARK